VIFKEKMDGGEQQQPAGHNVNAAPFNMDSLIAVTTSIQYECRLLDFIIEKPQAWFKCVEAQLEDAKVIKSKDKYNKVLGKLPFHIIEDLGFRGYRAEAMPARCLWPLKVGEAGLPAELPWEGGQ
jgi:hypothetical protein